MTQGCMGTILEMLAVNAAHWSDRIFDNVTRFLFLIYETN